MRKRKERKKMKSNRNLHIIRPIYSKEDKIKMFNESGAGKKLGCAEKLNLMLWEILEPKKSDRFYEMLGCGCMVKYAYEAVDGSCKTRK